MKVRISVGSAARLGLNPVRVDCLPTTIYIMTAGVCRARCLFCSQWVSKDRLSRVQWPEYSLEDVISRIENERVCIQCLNYDNVYSDVLDIVENLKSNLNENPISVSAQPFLREQIERLKHKIDRISINLDCATPELFQKMKPYYNWEDHLSKLLYARDVFGPFRASSHLIVGLGEREEQMVKVMKFLYDHDISSSLFAFTPVKGTPLENRKKPPISYYRRMQAAHYLTYRGEEPACDRGGTVTINEDVPPEAFMTRGCPGCNRPYYTETPRNVYNFPFRPGSCDMDLIAQQLTDSSW